MDCDSPCPVDAGDRELRGCVGNAHRELWGTMSEEAISGSDLEPDLNSEEEEEEDLEEEEMEEEDDENDGDDEEDGVGKCTAYCLGIYAIIYCYMQCVPVWVLRDLQAAHVLGYRELGGSKNVDLL